MKKNAPLSKKKSAASIAADEVKSARLRAGMTQTELAVKVGTSQKGIGRLELGQHNPTIGTLERVADATDSVLNVQIRPRKAA